MKFNTINLSFKKTITLITICVVFSFLFSACSSNMSITKRHYNNGYYIAHSKSIKAPIENTTDKKTTKNEVSTPVYASASQKSESTTGAYIANNPIETTTTATEQLMKTQHVSSPLKQDKQLPNYKNKLIEKPVLQINNTQKNTTTSNGEALSLLWIVILVILILWLFGFIAGGLGLGGLINILLLIALILFILWILRVL